MGWRRFAVGGDLARVDLAGLGRREAADVGVSYSIQRFSGRVQLGVERATAAPLRPLPGGPGGVQLDVGGSYALSRNIDLSAGVRYRRDERDRLLPQGDDRRDSQAVYVGTALRF